MWEMNGANSPNLELLSRRWSAAAFTPNSAFVSVAQNTSEMIEIGRLRYRFYVARDRKGYAHVDHKAELFLEPIDQASLNFQVLQNRECIAAVRLTHGLEAQSDPHLSRLIAETGFSHLQLENTAIYSRFVVRDLMSARLRLPHLLCRVYRIGVLSGIAYWAIATRPSLKRLFERFGFRRVATYRDHIAGDLEVMVFDVFRPDDLQRIEAPYLKEYERQFPGCALQPG